MMKVRPKRRMSKFDSLRPVLNMLETFLISHGVDRVKADNIVLGTSFMNYIEQKILNDFLFLRYC